MKFFEFEAKRVLEEYGIPVPEGHTAANAAEAAAIAGKIGRPVALKSQILVSGRGKAGGILFAEDAAGAGEAASKLIGSRIKGIPIRSLLIEEKLEIIGQFYASVAVDRQARKYTVLASTEGGVDIEQTALESPEKIARYNVYPATGLSQPEAAGMLERFNLNANDAGRLASILSTLYGIAMDSDAELVELNPLVKTAKGELVAADARIIVDDNAIFRHPELRERSLEREDDTPREAEARKQNLAYVDLDGDTGIVGNGAGLVMSTIDCVQLAGGRPGNFLDIGGGGNVEITEKGLRLVMEKPEIKRVLVNVLGGITRCDVVAEAIVRALDESGTKKPLAVRLVGTNEDEGARILNGAGIKSHRSMEDAVEEVLKL